MLSLDCRPTRRFSAIGTWRRCMRRELLTNECKSVLTVCTNVQHDVSTRTNSAFAHTLAGLIQASSQAALHPGCQHHGIIHTQESSTKHSQCTHVLELYSIAHQENRCCFGEQRDLLCCGPRGHTAVSEACEDRRVGRCDLGQREHRDGSDNVPRHTDVEQSACPQQSLNQTTDCR